MEVGVGDANIKLKAKKNTWQKIKKQKTLVIMSIPFILYVAVFCYAPLAGWLMAFQKYKPAKGIFNQI